MQNNTQNRLINFELMRVLAMFFVIISHYSQHGLLAAIQTNNPVGQFFTMFLHTLGPIGVIIFVLLTGYFMIDKKTTVKHFFKIVLETIFYSWSILLLLVIFFNHSIALTPIMIYQSIFPILTSQYWFVTAYLILYLLIPILNKFFSMLDKQTLSVYLILFLVIWFVIPLFGYKIKLAGSSTTNFICLYFIGAYMKKYALPFFDKTNNAILTIICSESIVCLYLIILIINHIVDERWFMHLSWSNSILAVLTSTSIFSLLKNWKLDSNYNSIVTFFSSSAFSVYLITENICIRKMIWINIFHCNLYQGLFYMLINMIFAVSLSYLICTLIDKIRIKLFEQNVLKYIEILYNIVCKFVQKGAIMCKKE